MHSALHIMWEIGLKHCLSVEAGRQIQGKPALGGTVFGIVLIATSGCIDTFYSATGVTNLVSRIDAKVIDDGSQG